MKQLGKLWKRLWGEPSGINPRTADWFPYMLQSRKFRQLLFVDLVVLLFAFVVVCLFKVTESPIVDKALSVLETVTIAYFGLNVAQKIIESRGGKKRDKESEGDG